MSTRSSGFTPQVRAVIAERDGGCVMCGRGGAYQIHHRAPRGLGGSKAAWINAPSNGITLCPTDHAWVEKHRTRAEQLGYIVRRGIHPPTAIPVEHAQHGVVFLTDDGGITHQPPETP